MPQCGKTEQEKKWNIETNKLHAVITHYSQTLAHQTYKEIAKYCMLLWYNLHLALFSDVYLSYLIGVGYLISSVDLSIPSFVSKEHFNSCQSQLKHQLMTITLQLRIHNKTRHDSDNFLIRKCKILHIIGLNVIKNTVTSYWLLLTLGNENWNTDSPAFNL